MFGRKLRKENEELKEHIKALEFIIKGKLFEVKPVHIFDAFSVTEKESYLEVTFVNFYKTKLAKKKLPYTSNNYYIVDGDYIKEYELNSKNKIIRVFTIINGDLKELKEC